MGWLQKGHTGKRIKPIAILIYGVHGIGKSTLPSEANNPVYVGSEENDELDSDNALILPKIKSWADLEGQLKELLETKHDRKTLVLDTVDSLEQVASTYILGKSKGLTKGTTLNTIYGGYGKGPDEMALMFLKLRDNYLIPLRDKKGMNVILLAHSTKVKHEDPLTNTSYDKYETALHKKVKPIFEDWVSAILFANYKNYKAETGSGKEYLEGEGDRVLYTQERPAHEGKNRFNFPYEIDFTEKGTWKVISDLIKAYFAKAKKVAKEKNEAPVDSELNDLMGTADDLLKKMPEELKSNIQLSIKRAKGNKDEYKRLINKMEGVLK